MTTPRLCVITFLLLSILGATAQGIVSFRNENLMPPPDRLVRFPNGTGVIGTTFAVQLLYGTDPLNLTPHPTLAYFRATASPGTWSGGGRTLTGIALPPTPQPGTTTLGAQVWMQIRAWDAGTGRTMSWDQARAGGVWGESLLFTYQQRASDPSDTQDTAMRNFAGFTIGQCGIVRITQPAGGIVRHPETVTFECASNLPEVNITNVTYVSGGGVLGQAATPPFAVSTNLPVGDYLVQAITQIDTGQTCTSDPFLVRVMVPPNPVVTPAEYLILRGQTTTFTASPGGSEPNSYEWYFQNGLISNASGASLTLPNVSEAMEGLYMAVVSNAVGIATSAPVTLKVRSVVVLIDDIPIQTPSYTSSVPVTVRLVTSFPRGTIFYTLDGSTPDFSSRQYLEPFTVDRTVHLRAIGYSADFFESREADPVHISLPPLRFLSASSGGGGSISVSPNSSSYLQGEIVTLTAQPDSGWSFLEWRGDVSGTNAQVSLIMNSDRCVRALFGTTLTTTTFGNGRIVLNPPGNIYPYGSAVRLYAVPGTNSFFVLWGNYANGSDNPLLYSVIEPNPAVSSAFATLPTNQVTFAAIPDGDGYFDITPRTNRYTRGQTVSVRAYPVSGVSFVQWSGDATETNDAVSVALDQSKTVTGHFTKTPRLITDPCHIGYNNEGFYTTLWGAWGARYDIHFGDLLGSWYPLLTLTNSYGTTQFVDPTASNAQQRFYRAIFAEP